MKDESSQDYTALLSPPKSVIDSSNISQNSLFPTLSTFTFYSLSYGYELSIVLLLSTPRWNSSQSNLNFLSYCQQQVNRIEEEERAIDRKEEKG